VERRVELEKSKAIDRHRRFGRRFHGRARPYGCCIIARKYEPAMNAQFRRRKKEPVIIESGS
jgi:hypothetical protein